MPLKEYLTSLSTYRYNNIIIVHSVQANYGLYIALCMYKFQGHVLNMKWENDKMALQEDYKRQCGIAKSIIIIIRVDPYSYWELSTLKSVIFKVTILDCAILLFCHFIF